MTQEKLPLAIEIEINSGCNLSCSYCPNSKFERIEQGHMPVELYEKIMRQLQAQSYAGRISYHFYNEPTLSPNLDLFVEMTKSYLPKARTNLFSNGTLLNKKKIDRLFTLGLDKFSITEHEKIFLKRVRQVQSELGPVDNEKLKFVTFMEIPLSNRGGALPEIGRNVGSAQSRPCLVPKCVLIITLKGNVIPCFEDYFQKNVMGNIGEQDLFEIWNSPKYVQFRQDLKLGQRQKYEACRDCNNYLIIN